MFDVYLMHRYFSARASWRNMDDYKTLILKMLDMLDDRRLRLIYVHVKAMLGLR